jgi:hypothetical protein
MKKKKIAEMIEYNLWCDNVVKIGKDPNQYFFEIGPLTTNDLAEGVAILMKYGRLKFNEEIWKINLDKIDYYNISPDKALYWLTGGDYEWKEMHNYKKTWHESALDFQEEFGLKIINILKLSKNLNDIREMFDRHLSLPTLYEFALEKEII